MIDVEGKQVKLKKSAKKTALFQHLLKKSEIFFSEVAGELDGDVGSNFDPRNQYYGLCRGIESSFNKQGVLDFIIFDFNKASINKLYKKVKA